MHAAMRGVGTCGMRGMQRGRSRGAYACGHAGSWNVRHAGHAVWKSGRFFFQVTLINDMKINFSELSYLIMLFAFLNSLSVRSF